MKRFKNLTSLLQSAGHCSIPWAPGRVARGPIPWWSEECRQAVCRGVFCGSSILRVYVDVETIQHSLEICHP
ncbi:hypothetical protein Hamer_G000056 [Homarus americanus]|uniref:Uncharacterized protein n=1 Tax=Homarus americanus TaxID=6706 RepID=A0A8J5TJT4_HOMAM|nr:hypothetical protein Hamer_G000056 [Homarus americanus]